MTIFAAICSSDRYLVSSRKFFRSLPTIMFYMAVSKRKIASLIMAVRRQFSPHLVGRHGENAVVDALLMFIDENESLAGACD